MNWQRFVEYCYFLFFRFLEAENERQDGREAIRIYSAEQY